VDQKMKRLLLLAAVAAFGTALPLSHFLMASPAQGKGPPQGKVTICHLTPDGEDFPCGGHYIRVAQNAVQKFLDRGDFVDEEGVVGEPCACGEE
jgi:hypothetical protein